MNRLKVTNVKAGHIAFNKPKFVHASKRRLIGYDQFSNDDLNCTQVKTLAQDTIIANARFFGGNVDLVPKQVKLTTHQAHQKH